MQPLDLLIARNKTTTQINVLDQLIINKVSIDTSMIQKALEACFSQLCDENQEELENCILKITNTVLMDPSKYLTLDFMNFLITRLMDTKRDQEAENILLDPRISVTLYPDLWSLYIERQCKTDNF